MKKELSFTIDSDVYEKLTMALKLSGEEENEVFETCLKSYIAKTFGAVSEEIDPDRKKAADEKEYHGKAIQRIPIWALKPNQLTSKIIRAFFKLADESGKARLDELKKLCGNPEDEELYVSTFKNNYSQMKIDGPKSYGKVFEDDGEYVWIWEEVKDVLLKHKDAFLN